MTNNEFETKCKEIVRDYYNSNLEPFDLRNENGEPVLIKKKPITTDAVFIVWICKTLQNNKALLSTTIADGMYYEITYNGDKREAYVDVYQKKENYCVSMEYKFD